MRHTWTILFAITACTAQSPESSSVKHDLGRPTNEASANQWLDLSADEFKRIVLNSLLREGPDAAEVKGLAEDDPLTVRTQFWLTQLDAAIRAKHPAELAMVPKPKAMVVPSTEVNAFVSPVSQCVDMSVRVQKDVEISATDKEIKAAKHPDALMYDRSTRTLDDAGGVECLHPALTPKERKELVHWVFDGMAGCDYRIYGNALVVTPSCFDPKNSSITVGASAKQLMILRTASYVTVFTAIVPTMSEDEMVSVLAHELGHYYMSHVTAPSDLYNYTFTQSTDRNAGQKPAKDPKTAALSAEVQDAGSHVFDTIFFPAAGQKYHSALFSQAESLSFALQSDACGEFAKFFRDAEDKHTFGFFPFLELPAEAATAYQRYEELLGNCLASKPADGLTFLKAGIAANTTSLFRDVAAASTATDLEALWNELNAAAPGLIAQRQDALRAVFKKAFDRNMGYYTTEQEADELSLEWGRLIGIDPDVAISSELSLLHSHTEDNPADAIVLSTPADECETLFHNDWKDESGNPVMVPIGDWIDLHHSSCYRMFNMTRETAVHGYHDAPLGPKPQADGPSWADLQAKADELSKAAAPSPAPTPATLLRRR